VKYKKLLIPSFLLASVSPVLYQGISHEFGFPFGWIQYRGHDTSFNSVFQVFTPDYFGDTFFSIGILALNSFLIGCFTLIVFKTLKFFAISKS
jgi:hypothetical protein